jgi:hypothetical protein
VLLGHACGLRCLRLSIAMPRLFRALIAVVIIIFPPRVFHALAYIDGAIKLRFGPTGVLLAKTGNADLPLTRGMKPLSTMFAGGMAIIGTVRTAAPTTSTLFSRT